ncbi:hypothetical protein JTB14_018829 [Gonioctena quinquepunctata]|nr:hypothetical protein JTB14_018829 [Gonioctena quinquepunctata]
MDHWLIKLPSIDMPSTSNTLSPSNSTINGNTSLKRKIIDENEDCEVTEVPQKLMQTPSKRNFKFRLEWLQEDIFKEWLIKEEHVVSSRSNSNVMEYAHCKICNVSILPHRNDLVRHIKTQKHIFKARQDIQHLLTSQRPQENKIRYAEIKLAALLAARNLPFSLMDDLVDVCAEVYSDPVVAQKLKLKRTKATAVLTNVLAPNIQNDLIKAVSSPGSFFSVIVDETTDTSTIKQCAFVIIYCDNTNKIQTRFFDIIEQNKGDAESLYSSLKKCFEDKNFLKTKMCHLKI